MNETITPTHITLNMDILLAILSFSPPKTATSIMTTCRFLYHEGAKVILRWPIRLYGFEQDLALLRFIQAEDLSRCAYVRNLSILANGYSEVVAGILVNIVPRMSSLEHLCVRGEHLLQRFPDLLPAFASLRSVKTLIVEDAGDKSLELVRTIQSELVTAKILFFSRVFGIFSFPASNHPIQLLRRSASTLQDVECEGWCDNHTNVQAIMSSSQIIYPNIRTLVLRNGGDVHCLPPYIRAFPNLIHLRVEGDCPVPKESQNQAQIDMTLQGVHWQGTLVWKHLQTYTGTLRALRALRINFRIPRLYFITLPHDGSSLRLGLTEVLAYARPIHLTIAFEDRPFSESFLSADLLTALRSDGGSGLQSLSLTIDVMAADMDKNFDIGQFWTSIETIFSRLQLCSLDIVMRDTSVPEAPNTATFPSFKRRSDQSALTHEHVEETAHYPADPAGRPEGAPCLVPYSKAKGEHRASFTLAERTLEDFDVGTFVRRLTASIPTLQHAVVSIERPSRWAGGIMRTARLGKYDESEKRMNINIAENSVLYEEYKVVPKGSNNRGWASLARAWYQGLNEGRGA